VVDRWGYAFYVASGAAKTTVARFAAGRREVPSDEDVILRLGA